CERSLDRRQVGDSGDHPEALDRRALRITELALHVLDERRAAITPPEAKPIGLAQTLDLLRIERGACFDDAFEPVMEPIALDAVLVRRTRPCDLIDHTFITQHRHTPCKSTSLLARTFSALPRALCSTINDVTRRNRSTTRKQSQNARYAHSPKINLPPARCE